MIEVIYRIYKVLSKEEMEENNEGEDNNLFPSYFNNNKKEVVMDCIVCDNREHFKDIIKSNWGENITFRYSKNLKPGDYYCIIIGEHCWNVERYFTKIEYECSYCKAKVSTYVNRGIITIDDFECKHSLYGDENYKKLKFCSEKCKRNFIDSEHNKLLKDSGEDFNEFFVTKDMFTLNNTSGYIYKITKKSTGEFYVGQTQYLPVFRWAQHLKTERFPQSNITDYQFEVIEIVNKSSNLLEREKYWIQECYKQCPEKSLNIMQTADAKKEAIAMKLDIFNN